MTVPKKREPRKENKEALYFLWSRNGKKEKKVLLVFYFLATSRLSSLLFWISFSCFWQEKKTLSSICNSYNEFLPYLDFPGYGADVEASWNIISWMGWRSEPPISAFDGSKCSEDFTPERHYSRVPSMNAFLYSPVLLLLFPTQNYPHSGLLSYDLSHRQPNPPIPPLCGSWGLRLRLQLLRMWLGRVFTASLLLDRGSAYGPLFVYTSLLWDRDNVQQKTRVPGFSLTDLTRAKPPSIT
jgi:hypothetical protein